MNRRSVLKSVVVAAPVLLQAQSSTAVASKGAILVAAGEDRFKTTSKTRACKVSGKDTNGALCVFEESSTAKGGPPLHLHHNQDEWFYVLQGEYELQVGKEKFRLKSGDSVLGPRELPHTFSKVGNGPWKRLMVYQPAGEIEKFYHEIEQIRGGPSTEQFERLFRDHGMELVGPPLPAE